MKLPANSCGPERRNVGASGLPTCILLYVFPPCIPAKVSAPQAHSLLPGPYQLASLPAAFPFPSNILLYYPTQTMWTLQCALWYLLFTPPPSVLLFSHILGMHFRREGIIAMSVPELLFASFSQWCRPKCHC